MAGSSELYSPILSDALVILGAAGLVIPVFARFRITPIIGVIVVGLLVGTIPGGYGVPASAGMGRLSAALVLGKPMPEDMAALGLTLNELAPDREGLARG